MTANGERLSADRACGHHGEAFLAVRYITGRSGAIVMVLCLPGKNSTVPRKTHIVFKGVENARIG